MLPFKDAGGLLQYEWLRQNYGAYTTELKAYKAKRLNGERVLAQLLSMGAHFFQH